MECAERIPGRRDDYEWNGPDHRQSWRVRIPPDVDEGALSTEARRVESSKEQKREASLLKATTVTGRMCFYHPVDQESAERRGRCTVM